MIQVVGFDGADEFLIADVAGAKNTHPTRQRQHPLGERVALHRQAALCKTHRQPALDPLWTVTDHLFIGG